MAADSGEDPSAPIQPEEEVKTLTDLEQIRVLADPLRLKILHALSEERTTKQVADLIGEKATKLYHHVEQLERTGLIRRTRSRQNRGTVERYFIAAARSFRADAGAFAATADPADRSAVLEATITTIFDATADDLRELARIEPDLDRLDEQAILTFCELRSSPAEIERVGNTLKSLLAELQTLDDDTVPAAEQRRYRLTLAFFPLDVTRPGEAE